MGFYQDKVQYGDFAQRLESYESLDRALGMLFGEKYSLLGKNIKDNILRVLQSRQQRPIEPNDPVGLATGYPKQDWMSAAAMAGSAMLPTTASIFAGRKAKTSDTKALARTDVGINAGGMTPAAARQSFGWFKGQEGKWRFEIDDSEAVYVPDIETDHKIALKLQRAGGAKLDDVLKHPELFKAYPELKDINVSKRDLGGPGARYIHEQKEIALDKDTFLSDKAKESLLHEVQHAIQEIEGFARGGSPESMRSVDIESLKPVGTKLFAAWQVVPKEIRRQFPRKPQWGLFVLGKADDVMIDDIESLLDFARNNGLSDTEKAAEVWLEHTKQVPPDALSRYERYHNLLGEKESRDAAARHKLTPEERRTIPPYSTQEYVK
uniref:Large polyvalent protein associated domain-containing protein n=1 Tax=viral metagenome TaxID=1070528 RepID=A0A6H1ZND9_9ZZZZ